jgi:hypothetical protein
MTNEPVKAPDAWVWMAAAYLVAAFAAAVFGTVGEWIVGFLVFVLGGSAVVTICRWLWLLAREQMRPHRG